MTLDRDELAARVLVALAPLREGVPADVAREALEFANAFDRLATRYPPAPVAPVADAAPAPSATAAKGSDAGTAAAMPDATDQRRTVGAVVTWAGFTFIVVNPGNGSGVMRDLFIPGDPLCPTSDSDTFLRWATREECERHGIPYVERGAAPSPAASPAAYVPKVGDVVYVNDRTNAVVYTGYDSRKSPFPHRGVFVHSKIADGWTDGSDFDFVRVATDVDRAIAGLPPITPDHPQGGQGAAGDQRVAAGLDAPAVDDPALEIALVDAVSRVEGELWAQYDACRRRRIVVDAVLPVVRARLNAPAKPAVDREGLAKATYEAVRDVNPLLGTKSWDEVGDRTKDDSRAAADAAIRFIGGAS